MVVTTRKTSGGAKSASPRKPARRKPSSGAKKATKAKRAAKSATGQPEPMAESVDLTKRVLVCRLSAVENCLRVTWSVEGDDSTNRWMYHISCADLERRTAATRDALERLQAVAAPTLDMVRCSEALRVVAESGVGLYATVMSSSRLDCTDKEREEDRARAAAFRKWFEDNVAAAPPRVWSIDILHKSNIQPVVPWGLVFTPPKGVDLADLGSSFEDYQNFWSIRHGLAYYHHVQYNSESAWRPLISSRKFRFTIVREWADGRFMRITDDTLGPDARIESRKGLNDRVRNNRLWHHIVYFDLRHGSSGNFALGEQELSDTEFGRILSKLDKNSTCLCVIDRDAIVRGDRGQGWVSTLFHERWQGFIATEADIDNRVLHGFGIQLLATILTAGEPLSECIYDVRRRHWPWSLLYGVYCNPRTFYIGPQPEFAEDMLLMAEALFENLTPD